MIITNRALLICVTLLPAFFLFACQNPASDSGTPSPGTTASPSSVATPDSGSGELKTTPSGLQYQDLVIGDGPKPLYGQTVTVHYTGTFVDGKQFETSVGGRPISFKLGRGEVIKGWDIGIGGDGGSSIAAMRTGGKRKLIIPPALGYGAQDNGRIPPNSTLVFEIELLGIKQIRSF